MTTVDDLVAGLDRRDGPILEALGTGVVERTETQRCMRRTGRMGSGPGAMPISPKRLAVLEAQGVVVGPPDGQAGRFELTEVGRQVLALYRAQVAARMAAARARNGHETRHLH